MGLDTVEISWDYSWLHTCTRVLYKTAQAAWSNGSPPPSFTLHTQTTLHFFEQPCIQAYLTYTSSKMVQITSLLMTSVVLLASTVYAAPAPVAVSEAGADASTLNPRWSVHAELWQNSDYKGEKLLNLYINHTGCNTLKTSARDRASSVKVSGGCCMFYDGLTCNKQLFKLCNDKRRDLVKGLFGDKVASVKCSQF